MTTMRGKTYPDLLIIGAQRSGTSWLWRNLIPHPDVWMPPVKELHYFDRSPGYPSENHLATEAPLKRLLGRDPSSAGFRRKFAARLLQDLRRRRWDRARWDLRYFLGHVDDEWYASLFEPARGRITGDATPAYAMLAADDVRRIFALMPDVKIIFILRNPIERAWSHLRYDHAGPLREGTLSIAQMKKFIDSPTQALRSDYLRSIDVWSSVYPARQILVTFHDHLRSDPKRFLAEVADFLGLSPSERFPAPWVDRVLNASIDSGIPAEIEHYLAEKYAAQIEGLAERYGDPPARWLRAVRRVLQSAG